MKVRVFYFILGVGFEGVYLGLSLVGFFLFFRG